MSNVVNEKTALPLRNDTLLGVCEALGEDFKINATWIRLAFIAPLFFAPIWTVAAYFGIGMLVAISRKLAPNKVERIAVDEQAPMIADNRQSEMKIAA